MVARWHLARATSSFNCSAMNMPIKARSSSSTTGPRRTLQLQIIVRIEILPPLLLFSKSNIRVGYSLRISMAFQVIMIPILIGTSD